jgi:hypothetical protein
VEDGWVNGNVLVPIRAQSTGYQSASNALSVLDDDQPTLTLTASTNELLESIGAGVATVTLSRNTSTNNDLIVNLISSDSSRLAAPASVIIPAGARTVSFPLATVDNQSPNAPLRATLTASAAGFAAVPATFQIIDDDTPLLVLTFADPAITEGAANPATTLTVTRDPVLPARARLGFQSANPGVASVPSTAIILSNQPSVTIPVAVGNNSLVDGRREVTFTAFVLDEATGSPIPGASYTNRLVVNDDDGPTLTIHVNSDIISESGSTTGTVSRNTPATSNLVVKLDSSLTTEATVPSTVTIPVNQSSVNFSINGVPDGVGDGTKRVTITASATGFNSANASLNVSDVDLPDLRPVDITSTNFATTGSVIPVSFTITNNGLSDADGTWVDRIYLARSPAGDGAQMVAQATRFGGLALNTSYTRTLPVGLPETVGNYWLIVRVDEAGALNEGTKQNNRLVASSPVEISAAYHAMVETEIDTGFPGSVVPVHGYAYRAHDLSPAPNSRVSVRVLVKGTRRTFSAWSDTQGNFTNWFQMLPNEAGRVSLAADHPGVETDTVQDTVDIYGLRFNSYELTHRIFPNINTTNTQPMSSAPLFGHTSR